MDGYLGSTLARGAEQSVSGRWSMPRRKDSRTVTSTRKASRGAVGLLKEATTLILQGVEFDNSPVGSTNSPITLRERESAIVQLMGLRPRRVGLKWA